MPPTEVYDVFAVMLSLYRRDNMTEGEKVGTALAEAEAMSVAKHWTVQSDIGRVYVVLAKDGMIHFDWDHQEGRTYPARDKLAG